MQKNEEVKKHLEDHKEALRKSAKSARQLTKALNTLINSHEFIKSILDNKYSDPEKINRIEKEINRVNEKLSSQINQA